MAVTKDSKAPVQETIDSSQESVLFSIRFSIVFYVVVVVLNAIGLTLFFLLGHEPLAIIPLMVCSDFNSFS